MKTFIYFSVILVFFTASAFAQTGGINIIPQPSRVIRDNKFFEFSKKTKFFVRTSEEKELAKIFNEFLDKNYGFKLKFSSKENRYDNTIRLLPPRGEDQSLTSDEAYHLVIREGFIIIYGQDQGKFYGLQTLLQLLPAKIENKKTRIPTLDILDQPRFSYRGMHLDVGRHFFPVEFVKKYIDLMAQYKFNQFHWHLTEDQGWRIEIKKYPKLTEIGSRRKETQVEKNRDPYIGDAVPVEGFYTQEQIREVVAYAKARRINVIPEIELPGHSSAALAAYPELGCKENYEYKVKSTWGIFREVYCPSEATFKFLEDVLEETIALFPDSPYIHIGGDEVLKDHWKESAFVQELKAKENLKDEHEVQSYFIRRMEKFINSKGKKIIGWDEILEGGLAPNATVMSWRGEKGGIEAAKAKHDVIMTPTDFMYFDFGQGDSKTEPINIGNYLPLEKVYSYNPHPKELSEDEKKYVLGAQANVWTEYIKTPEKVEYMVFPRLLALSEVVWSPLESKNFANFQTRLFEHFPRLDKQNVNYRIPEPVNLQNGLLNDGKCENCTARLVLLSQVPNSRIFYTLDGTEPTEKSSLLSESVFEVAVKRGEKVDLKTIVVLPNGRKSATYTATFWGREPLPAIDLKDSEAGATFRTYAKSYASVDEIKAEDAESTGLAKTLGLMQFREKLSENAPFAVEFEGYINVPKDEIYEFDLTADDGAALWIDDQKLVDNDGVKEKFASQSGIVPLKKGYHRFVLKYFKGPGKWALGLRWGIKGQPLRFVSANELFRPKL